MIPLTLPLSLQGRGETIHPPSRAGGILAYFYKKDPSRKTWGLFSLL